MKISEQIELIMNRSELKVLSKGEHCVKVIELKGELYRARKKALELEKKEREGVDVD